MPKLMLLPSMHRWVPPYNPFITARCQTDMLSSHRRRRMEYSRRLDFRVRVRAERVKKESMPTVNERWESTMERPGALPLHMY